MELETGFDSAGDADDDVIDDNESRLLLVVVVAEMREVGLR